MHYNLDIPFVACIIVGLENYKCTFNPIDKVVELYERMIKEKEDKIALLEKLLAEKK